MGIVFKNAIVCSSDTVFLREIQIVKRRFGTNLRCVFLVVDHFYVALFSALKQTHCVFM